MLFEECSLTQTAKNVGISLKRVKRELDLLQNELLELTDAALSR